MNKLAISGLCAALASAVLLSSCATYTGQTQDPNDPNRTRTGALIGAGIGAVAGLLTGDDAVERRQRALVGAGVGAIAGGGIGAYQDRQEAELRRDLAGTGERADARADQRTLASFDRVVAGQQAGHGADAGTDQCAGAGTVRVVRIVGLAGIGRAAGQQDGAGEGGAQSGNGELVHG